jgi:hypothetical protein
VSDSGEQIFPVEVLPIMFIKGEQISWAHVGGCAFPVERLFPAEQAFGPDGGQGVAFLRILEVLTINIHIALTLLVDKGFTFDLQKGFSVVVIPQDDFSRQSLVGGGKRGDDFFLDIHVCRGVVGNGCDVRDAFVSFPAVGDDQLVSPVFLFKEVIDALPLHPSGDEVEVGFLVLADVLPVRIVPGEFEGIVTFGESILQQDFFYDSRHFFLQEELIFQVHV